MKEMLKEWRIWVLAIALLLSFVFLNPHYVKHDGEYSIATGINKGLDLKGGTKVLLSVEGNNTTKSDVEQIKNILQRRVSAFGLTQTSVRTVRLGDQYKIQMEIASANRSQLTSLISREGQFEARIPIKVKGEKNFTLGDTYTFQQNGDQLTVDGETYKPGSDFNLGDNHYYYLNNTNGSAIVEVVAYSGQDIQEVVTSDSIVRSSGRGSYSFTFPVIISKTAAQRVTDISNNYQVASVGSEAYLVHDDGSFAKLNLYVDGHQQSSLRVGAVFKRQVITRPSINGGGSTEYKARQDMKELQAILQSGKLPKPVKIESVSTVSSSLGSQFMSAAVISVIGSLIAVGFLIFARYRDPKYVIPIVFTGSSEVFILLGMFFSTITTLDLASIAGIIAAVGTGVDDQIIITDESDQDKIRDWKKRLKRAFFVIFTSAASTIGAMFPVVSPSISNMAIGAAGAGLVGYEIYTRKNNSHRIALGAFSVAITLIAFKFNPSAFALQSIKGFAVTTILGVMVGITITRPAYAKMIEHLEK
ncbi:MAG: hypothetical protein ABEJ99_04695 [Candidatus Nanohaloarchaea archaeon]